MSMQPRDSHGRFMKKDIGQLAYDTFGEIKYPHKEKFYQSTVFWGVLLFLLAEVTAWNLGRWGHL